MKTITTKLTAVSLALLLLVTACNNNAQTTNATAPANVAAASQASATATTPETASAANATGSVKVNDWADMVKLDKELQPFVQTNPALWLGDKSDPFMGDIDAMNKFLAAKSNGASKMTGVFDIGIKGVKMIEFYNSEKKQMNQILTTNDTTLNIKNISVGDKKSIILLQGGDPNFQELLNAIANYPTFTINFLKDLPNHANEMVTIKKGNGSRKLLVVSDPASATHEAAQKTLDALDNMEISYIFVNAENDEANWKKAETEYAKLGGKGNLNKDFSNNALSKLFFKAPTIFNLSNFERADEAAETNAALLEKFADKTEANPEVELVKKVKTLYSAEF